MTSPAEVPRPAGAADYVLTLSVKDQPGIVYAVARFLFERGCNIVESHQFNDREAGMFFMRLQFEAVAGSFAGLDRLRSEFHEVADSLRMSWRFIAAAQKQRVLIMVSTVGHCLNDLLYRASIGGLNIEIAAVVSNHRDLAHLAAKYDIPFHHIPVTAATKPAAERQLLTLIDELAADLVVLARYMQILSDDLCDRLQGQAINIHHSMLPSFKGARPYHQAHQRGVKLIGATAHYVTTDLDEGPIIEQEVARVDHTMTADDVMALGRDTECLALARAVRWHTENRVVLDGRRTLVFR